MRIVFYTDQLHTHGGIEKVLSLKLNYFGSNSDYEVILLTTQQDGKPFCYDVPESIQHIDLGIKYNRARSYFSPGNLLKTMVHSRSLRKTLRRILPDVVIVCNYDPGFYVIPSMRGFRSVKEFHSSQFWRTQSHNVKGLKRLVYKRQLKAEKKYDALVVLHKEEAGFFSSGKTWVIPNPVELTPNYTAELTNKKVLFVGRLAPVKGLDRMIRVWESVCKSHPDWELHLFGDDFSGTRTKLETQITASKTQGTVRFMGSVTNIRQVMSEYSMLLMTSLSECFPMVILEAFSVGLPVVAFDVPTGPRNIITHGKNGMLVPDGDAETMAGEVEALIRNTEKRSILGANAKADSSQYALNTIMKAWEEMLETLLENDK